MFIIAQVPWSDTWYLCVRKCYDEIKNIYMHCCLAQLLGIAATQLFGISTKWMNHFFLRQFPGIYF